MQPDPELLGDARSMLEAIHCMLRYVSDATEKFEDRIDAEDLNGEAETVELREALEQVQAISLEISEELDAYQNRHAR